MSIPLFISTSPSDFHILKELVKEQSKFQKVDFLILFKLEKSMIVDLEKKNIKLIFNDLKLANKSSSSVLIKKDLKKINDFFIDYISKKNSNNLIIILGDRYELLPIAQILYLFKKIVIHLHGGEITQGSWDDSIRHSISKLSRIHFVTSNSAKEILLRLGEQRKNIYNFGSLGAENVKNIKIQNKNKLFKELNLNSEFKTSLLVMQPITNQNFNIETNFNKILKFLEVNNFQQLVVSKINNDPGSEDMINYFTGLCSESLEIKLLDTLGLKNYISLAKHVDLVLGNSSSFIFEFPVKNIKSILLTNRQAGRELNEQIFISEINLNSLQAAYEKLVSTKTKSLGPYYKKNTSKNIARKIFEFSKNKPEFYKEFK